VNDDGANQGLPCDADGNVLSGIPVHFDTIFKNTASLKLTFPEWIDLDESGWQAKNGDNWWINTSGTSGYFGLSEFQAFAAIPEPATMTLLALGGLAMLRRRRAGVSWMDNDTLQPCQKHDRIIRAAVPWKT